MEIYQRQVTGDCSCGRPNKKLHCAACGSAFTTAVEKASVLVQQPNAELTGIETTKYMGHRCRNCGKYFDESMECKAPPPTMAQKRLLTQDKSISKDQFRVQMELRQNVNKLRRDRGIGEPICLFCPSENGVIPVTEDGRCPRCGVPVVETVKTVLRAIQATDAPVERGQNTSGICSRCNAQMVKNPFGDKWDCPSCGLIESAI